MATLDEMIAAAQKRVSESTDETTKARAEAELAALNNVKSAGYTFTQNDINQSVSGRLPDAEANAKKAERQALADKLGVSVDKLDEELARLEEERKGKQSETQRLSTDLTKREQELETEREKASKAERQAETARLNLEHTLKRQAVERELVKKGVVMREGDNRLSDAMGLTDFSGVEVEVEVAEDGSLNIKGEVKGADKAAEATFKDKPYLFSTGTEGKVGETPSSKRGSGDTGDSGKTGGYRPKSHIPRAS